MTHRSARLLVVAAVLAFFAPLVLGGRVLRGDDSPSLGDAEPVQDLERKFRDQTHFYLPELHVHLQGARSGWIATWNPHVELGRPTFHISGVSPAFLPVWLLSLVSDDAEVVYTWLVILAVLLTGWFGCRLCEALELRPAAAAAGGLFLCLGVYVTFWLTFALYVWGVCWTVGLLWVVLRYLDRAGWASALGIAACLHALLLTAYPQQIVWTAWLLLLVGLGALGRVKGGARRRLRLAGGVVLSAALGVASALPVLADLALAASRSPRVNPGLDFFRETVPELEGAGERLWFLSTLFDAFWYGDPSSRAYPIKLRGLSWSPLVWALVPLALFPAALRRFWPYAALAAAALAATLLPPVYLFAVEHLGLSLSRYEPLAAAHVPVALLAAAGADRVLAAGHGRRAGVAAALLPAAVALAGALLGGVALDRTLFALGAALFLGALAFLWTRSAPLLLVLALAGVLHYGARLVQSEARGRENPAERALVDLARAHTGGETRLAWVSSLPTRSTFDGDLLGPNREALFDLRSIHSYDPLPPRGYQDWARRMSSDGLPQYERALRAIDAQPQPFRRELGYSGVGLLLSSQPIQAAFLEPLLESEQLYAYRPKAPPLAEAQVRRFARDEGRVEIQGALPAAEKLPVERTLDRGDRLRFELTPAPEETLLFVSQQHHPQWRARAGGSGDALETVIVNGFYQGVVVPPGTAAVELAFRPWSRWSFLGPLALAGAWAALRARDARRRASLRAGRA